jgi:hypothetical protein
MNDNWYLIASAISRILQAVEGVGTVYMKQSWVAVEDDLRELLIASPETGDVNAWSVARSGIHQDRTTMPPQQFLRLHQYTIRGYCSVAGDSETRFQSLVESVLDAFGPQFHLDVAYAAFEQLPQVIVITEKEISPEVPYVHYAEILIVVAEGRSLYPA